MYGGIFVFGIKMVFLFFNLLNSCFILIVFFIVINNEIVGFIGNFVLLLVLIVMNICLFNVNIECCIVLGLLGLFLLYLVIVIILLFLNKFVYSLIVFLVWLLNIKNVVIFGIFMLCFL